MDYFLVPLKNVTTLGQEHILDTIISGPFGSRKYVVKQKVLIAMNNLILVNFPWECLVLSASGPSNNIVFHEGFQKERQQDDHVSYQLMVMNNTEKNSIGGLLKMAVDFSFNDMLTFNPI